NRASPLAPFSSSSDILYTGHEGRFWGAFAASELLTWLFLVVAVWALPRFWHEQPVAEGSWFKRVWRLSQKSMESSAARARRGARLMPINPVLWLVARDRRMLLLIWGIVAAWGLMMVVMTFAFPRGRGAMGFWANPYPSNPFAFLLKLVFAVQTCRFFAEARRTGAIELLLSTPLTNHEILRGQTLALRRTFLMPVLVFLAFQWLPIAAEFVRAAMMLDLGAAFINVVAVGFTALNSVVLLVDLLALYWFGMWLAVT